MAWTQTQIDALKTAIAHGVKTVVYTDRTVTYHSIAEMLQVLAAMEAEVNATGTSSNGRVTYAGWVDG